MSEVSPSLVLSPSLGLAAVGRHLRELLEAALDTLGLSLRHLSVLGHLKHQPDLSYSDLARRAGVTPQSMRATVLQLEAAGAVAHHRDATARAARLELTDSGRELLERAAAVVTELDDRVLAGMSAERRDMLRELLGEVAMRTSPAANTSRRAVEI